MEAYMYPICLNTPKNNRSMDIDILNTHINCGSIPLNQVSSPSFMEIFVITYEHMNDAEDFLNLQKPQ